MKLIKIDITEISNEDHAIFAIKKGHFYKKLCELLIKRDIEIPEQKTITEKKIGTQKVQSPYEIYNRITTLIKQILKNENSEDVWKSGPQTNESFFQNLWNLPSENRETIFEFFQNQNNQVESEKAEKYRKIRDKFGTVFFKAVDEINFIFDCVSKGGSSFTEVWDKINNKKPSTKRKTSQQILSESVLQTKKCKKNESSNFSVDNCASPVETQDFRSPDSGYRIFLSVKINSFIELLKNLMI